MLAESAGFALLAAVSPTSMLVIAALLGSANPRKTAVAYVAGAVLMTVLMAVVLLFVLRATGLNQPHEQQQRYALRFSLGVVSLAAAFALARHPRRPPVAAPAAAEGKTRRPNLVSRLTANPGPRTAFLLGLLLFLPSTTFIAAVQVIATANASVAATTAAVIIVVALTALSVWLPLITYFVAPDATTRALATANEWLRVRGRTLVIGALWVAGIALVVDGALGLW